MDIVQGIVIVWSILGIVNFHETLSFTDVYYSDGNLPGLFKAIVVSGPLVWFLTIVIMIYVFVTERRLIKLFVLKNKG